MLAFERHNKILEILYKNKKVTTQELESFFSVSPCTIRNDLNKLEKNGLLQRMHGGAVLPQSSMKDLSFSTREAQHQLEKENICKKASEFITGNQCIIIDASSTTLYLSKYMDNVKNLTVITNGLYIADKLKDNTNINVILTGGVVRPKSNSLEGLLGKNLVEQINADMAFVSARGFTLDEGLTEFNIYEAELKKLLVSRAKKVIALMDYSKVGKNSISSFAKASQVDTLITNSKVSKDVIKEYMAKDLEVILCD
ncbi:DeoR/GlpR family DNA-binding transcription regulator [Clostridium sp. MSJ-11]|uniref:DeoR/GlpR family DNA-binding transcription regulator n=1 Tax=Clostridium mobile TaxID=2841512 RepID=A0ABS6EGR3_9CLOT|nr:DeoR/GlpR family DNA-binding transcription regulator [Clostridium mobile]MBU5483911.1 DeoR/GlpR family DNA-binding transcription regulator [Clostridium mobile]